MHNATTYLGMAARHFYCSSKQPQDIIHIEPSTSDRPSLRIGHRTDEICAAWPIMHAKDIIGAEGLSAIKHEWRLQILTWPNITIHTVIRQGFHFNHLGLKFVTEITLNAKDNKVKYTWLSSKAITQTAAEAGQGRCYLVLLRHLCLVISVTIEWMSMGQ